MSTPIIRGGRVGPWSQRSKSSGVMGGCVTLARSPADIKATGDGVRRGRGMEGERVTVRGLWCELKVTGMALFIGGTVWIYALAANLQEQELRIRYWPALAAMPEDLSALEEGERPSHPGVATLAE